jgi:hypothetical protein
MTGKLKKTNLTNLALYGYCLLLFSYVFYRALNISFTFDEVTTTQIANGGDWMNFGLTANNHFLNVVLIKVSLIFFDPSELIYRLPNVLGFILYLVYAFKIGKLLKPSAPYIPVILLTSMPFILDFFSLSRGYGLSLSFILPSIYFLLKYCQVNKIQFGIVSLLFGILAVLSNFTSFNYFLPSLLILFTYTLFSKEKVFTRIFTLSIITGTFLYYIIPVAFQLKNQGELYFGGRSNFYHDSLLSLSRTFAYHQLNISLAEIVFSMIFLCAILFSSINIFRAIRNKFFDIKIILPILFFLSILSPVAQHIIFETCFPTERTALLYYPILILVILNGINTTSVQIQNRLLKILTFSFLTHLILTSNLTHCYSWRFDSGSKEVISILKEESDRKGESTSISLGIDYLFTPSIWFYKSSSAFSSLSEHEVVHCWEYDMHLEELDPKYYGNSITRKDKLSHEDAENIASTNLNYYYLNDFVVKELIRLGYSVKVKKHFVIAGSSLIRLN